MFTRRRLSVVLYGDMHRCLVIVARERGVEIGDKVVDHRARTLGSVDDASPRR